VNERSIPTWKTPAFIVELAPERFDPNAGCHGQGDDVPATYLGRFVDIYGYEPRHGGEYVMIEREGDAERFATIEQARAAIAAYMPGGPDEGEPEPVVVRYEPLYRNRWGGPLIFITVMEIDYAYGGPAEGGWTYQVGRQMAICTADTRSEAERIRDEIRPYWEDQLGEEHVNIVIDWEPMADFPTVAPHYC